jgi:hypothetical protein
MTVQKASFPSDSIALKISTGNNSAGNGGNGYNYGDIINKPSIDFQPYNKAEGAKVDVKTGDHVDQKAYWDAGGANAKAEDYSKAYGGTAQSSGDQSNYSGYDTSNVYANTTATQDNWLAVNQSQQVYAGNGGNGGDYNYAAGGNVDVMATIGSEHFPIDHVV